MEINLSTLAKHFSDEDEAYKLIESIRWTSGPICPHCGRVDNAYLLKAAHKTTTGKRSDRRVWKCASCRKEFSVLVGTIFHGSHVPLSKWLLAFYMLSASKNGVAAWEIHRTLAITQKTAWFMMHRIREAMKVGSIAAIFTNTTIVADEAYIGGMDKNKHADKRTHKSGRPTDKTIVFTLIDAEKGESRSAVVPNIIGATLKGEILKNADPTGSVLATDEYKSYLGVGKEFAKHVRVDHTAGEYVRDGFGTNLAENFFSQLKRSIDGTHHHVSAEHLPRYLAEFDFRYTTRKVSDQERFALLMGRVGGQRLTYRTTTTS